MSDTPTITIPATLGTSLIAVLQVAADRGSFKLDEFGPIAAVVAELSNAIRDQKTEKEIETE